MVSGSAKPWADGIPADSRQAIADIIDALGPTAQKLFRKVLFIGLGLSQVWRFIGLGLYRSGWGLIGLGVYRSGDLSQLQRCGLVPMLAARQP